MSERSSSPGLFKKAAILVGVNALILAVLFLVVILGIEVNYRCKYSLQLPRNDGKTITWGHKVEKNRWGFRGRDFSVEGLGKEDFVIVVLGDSLTWGAGLSEGQRYSALLEKELKAVDPGRNIIVLNFGIPGGATTKERDVLKAIYHKVRPDLVIVGFCLNDTQERDQPHSDEREVYFFRIEPVLGALNRIKCRGTSRLIYQLYERMLLSAKKIPDWPEALDRTYAQDSVEWRNFRQALKDIAEMAKSVSPLPPVFISLNQAASVSGPTDYVSPDPVIRQYYLKWYRQAEQAAAEQGFVAVNCDAEFKVQLGKRMMAVVPHEDMHPTAEMNRIYAAKLLSVIKDRRLGLGER